MNRDFMDFMREHYKHLNYQQFSQTTIDMAEYVRPIPGDSSPPGKATSADVTPRGNLEATAEEMEAEMRAASLQVEPSAEPHMPEARHEMPAFPRLPTREAQLFLPLQLRPSWPCTCGTC